MNNQEEKLLKELAIRIKERRKELNISQEVLAEKCGFDRTYISLLERAKRNPSLFNISKLAEGLQISICDLLKGIQ